MPDAVPALVAEPRWKTQTRRGMNAAVAVGARALQQISTLVFTILAARFLDPAAYGVYSIAVAFALGIQTLTFTGYFQYLVTARQEERALLSTAFWLMTGFALAGTLALIALAGPIAAAFGAPQMRRVLILTVAVQPVIAVLAWYSAVLMRRGQMRRHFGILMAQNAIALLGGTAILLLWQSLYALVAVIWLREITGLVLYAAFARARPGLRFDAALARQATGVSGGLYGSRVLAFLSRNGADFLLGLTFSTAEAGLFRLGSRLAGGVTDVIAQPLQSFALTQFGTAHRAGQDLGTVLARFFGTVILLLGGVAATLVILAQDLVAALLDPAWLAAVGVTYAMAFRALLMACAQISEPVMAALERTGVLMRYNLVWALVSVGAVLLTAPLGLQVLAWSQAVAAGIAAISALHLMQRNGVNTAQARRAAAISALLVVIYALVLGGVWAGIGGAGIGGGGSGVAGAPGWGTLALGLVLALVLGLATIAAAIRLGAFHLRIFQG